MDDALHSLQKLDMLPGHCSQEVSWHADTREEYLKDGGQQHRNPAAGSLRMAAVSCNAMLPPQVSPSCQVEEGDSAAGATALHPAMDNTEHKLVGCSC